MLRLRSLNFGQRIVLVVALAGVVRTAGIYAVQSRLDGGWSAYAPISRESYHPVSASGWDPFPAALLWIALIAIWAAASVWLLGPSPRD